MWKRVPHCALIMIVLVALTGCASIQTRISDCQQFWANTFSAKNQIPRQERQALLAFDEAVQGGIIPAASGTFPCKSVPPPCQWSGVFCTSGHVTTLILSGKNLSGEIPTELGNLSHLRWLYLADNQLSGGIPPEAGNLSKLQKLHLADNQLSGSLPSEITKLSINTLYLSNTGLCIPQTAEFEMWLTGIIHRDFEEVPYCE